MRRIQKSIFIIVLAVMMLASQAFAVVFIRKDTEGYDVIWSDDSLLSAFFSALTLEAASSVCDVSPNASSYTYKVVVSYESLSSLVASASLHHFNTSLYRNDAAGYWVGYVHDVDGNFWNPSSKEPGVLGNATGHVYVADIDTTGEDAVSLLDSINRYLSHISTYMNFLASGMQTLTDSHRIIREWLDEWDAYFTNINTKVDSISSNISSIPTRLESMHDSILDISDVLTGDDFEVMLLDIGDISANLSQVKILLAQIYEQLISASTPGSLAANVAQMVTLLEGMQDLTISGDLTIDSVEMDTTALEEKLDAINTTLTSGLFYNNKPISQFLYFISNNITTLTTFFSQAGGHQTLVRLYQQLDVNSANTLAANISTMLTNQTEILTLMQEQEAVEIDTTAIVTAINNLESNQQAILTRLGERLLVSSTDLKVITAINNFEANMENLLTGKIGEVRFTVGDYISYTFSLIESMHREVDQINSGLDYQINELVELNASVENLAETLSEMNETTVENITNITINEDNDAYEVFYITDEDGNKESIADLGGDMLIAGGKLLNFFFKVAFDGAIESVDSTIDGMTEFYLDDAVVLEGSLWE